MTKPILDAPDDPQSQWYAIRSAMYFAGGLCTYAIIILFNVGLRPYFVLTSILVLGFSIVGVFFAGLGLLTFYKSTRRGENARLMQTIGLLGNTLSILIFLLILYANLMDLTR